MREIKFRAWDGTAMYIPIIYNGKVYRSDRDYEDGDYAPHDDVMQYTGLKDKNGNEIYEGDIVEEPYFSNINPLDRDDCEYIDDEPKLHIICYDSRQGMYKSVPLSTYKINAGNGGWTGYRIEYNKVTVIGNIYENPELLGRQATETTE